MVEKVEIIVDYSSLTISSRKSILGDVYWKVGNRFFPEEGWNDFVIVIMSWWLKTINNIKNGQLKSNYEFIFMDGPLFITSTKISEEILKLEFIKDKRDSQEIYFTALCNINQLQKSLLNASKGILDDIKIKKWHSDDIEELKRSILIN